MYYASEKKKKMEKTNSGCHLHKCNESCHRLYNSINFISSEFRSIMACVCVFFLWKTFCNMHTQLELYMQALQGISTSFGSQLAQMVVGNKTATTTTTLWQIKKSTNENLVDEKWQFGKMQNKYTISININIVVCNSHHFWVRTFKSTTSNYYWYAPACL